MSEVRLQLLGELSRQGWPIELLSLMDEVTTKVVNRILDQNDAILAQNAILIKELLETTP